MWKTESAESHNPVAREEIAALPLPGSPGLEWGQLWTLGERLALTFPSHPRPTALRSWALLLAAAARLRSDPLRSGRGVAHRLPPANFVHFRLSLLCKLQVMRGIGELRPLGPVLQAGRPGLSVVPAVFSQGLEKVPGNKSRDTPPSPSRARWRSVVVCAPPRLPFPELRVCSRGPGGGGAVWSPEISHPRITTA